MEINCECGCKNTYKDMVDFQDRRCNFSYKIYVDKCVNCSKVLVRYFN